MNMGIGFCRFSGCNECTNVSSDNEFIEKMGQIISAAGSAFYTKGLPETE